MKREGEGKERRSVKEGPIQWVSRNDDDDNNNNNNSDNNNISRVPFQVKHAQLR